ncbi:MAG: alkaline phosphatase D family protein [Sedimentisphaerales bacterium]|nr:alkaline phosphatase D family protein [Sedimentisphaerales bacterium]
MNSVIRKKLIMWAVVAVLLFTAGSSQAVEFQGSWSHVQDRVWVGPEYWANRLQDWQVSGGRLECVEARAVKPMRTIHLLTHSLSDKHGDFIIKVRTGLIGSAAKVSPRAAAGLLVGAAPDVDYKAAALVHHSPGPGGGLFAGIDARGNLFIRDFSKGDTGKNRAKNPPPNLIIKKESIALSKKIELRLIAKPAKGKYILTLSAHEPDSGRQLGRVSLDDVAPDRLTGSIALVSHPGIGKTGRFWFNNWHIAGSKIKEHNDRLCGPILCTQYTLDNNILKITAQMMPLGKKDNQTVILQTKQGTLLKSWKDVATTNVITPGWTAPFRVPNWDSKKNIEYRVVYNMKPTKGQSRQYTWSGTIRRDPIKKRNIVVAGFTGNHNVRHPGVDRGKYTWTNDWLWFPHNEIVSYVFKHKPDVLFFSGDQVYEGASPTAADQSGKVSSYLDYMYKWYLWCWAYRDLVRDIPCVTIPDDHDVYQGNIWGAGGRKTDIDNKGGYVLPAEFVKMVDRTQTSHLPDPYDPTPIKQGIGVYYTDMTYGRISFAIIEDRKFKSGCNGLCPPTKSGRPDHIIDPDFDPKTADVPGAKLLGDRQLKFLKDWAADWRGTDMKATLSQTVFAGMATHHGGNLQYLVADYDSNGWPQTGRNKALHEFRRCFAFMIGGDQHLATITHHGIDTWNDAGWSFTVPSIANFYPRAWWPKTPIRNHIEGMPDYTGECLDGLGNHVTVWAATNPDKKMGHEPAALHDKMPGYGIIRFDKKKRNITMECWPRFVDPTKPKTGSQYEGWPKTIGQLDNYGRSGVAYLPTLKIKRPKNPVVQIIDEANSEIVYTIRVNGKSFRPKVFRKGKYTIKVTEPDVGKEKTFAGVEALTPDEEQTIEVDFK